MITLIQKDLRQSLWPMLLALVFLLTPPLAWGANYVAEHRQSRPQFDVQDQLMMMFWLGAVASLVAASSIAGVAFAKERRERTGDLLATLPISRSKVVASKAIVALMLTLVPFIIGASLGYLVAPTELNGQPWNGFRFGNGSFWLLALGVSGWLLLFGLGWGLSSILRSEVLASAAPILVLIVGASTIALWVDPRPTPDDYRSRLVSGEELYLPRFVYPFAVIGATGLIAGTVIALRRKSP